MSRFNTGNPLDSSDLKDLSDNAKNIDLLSNGTSKAYIDRFGVERKTVHGMEVDFTRSQMDRENRFNDFLLNSGYVLVGDYAPGVVLSEYNQIVRVGDDEGRDFFWRASGQTDLPYTLTGSGVDEGGALVSVGDASLRQELTNPDKGAAMVARGVVSVDSIAELSGLPDYQRRKDVRYLVGGYHSGDASGGGGFHFDPEKVGEGDGIFVIDGFVREIPPVFTASMAGVQDGVTVSATSPFARMCKTAFDMGVPVIVDKNFTVSGTITLEGRGSLVLLGTGEITQTARNLFEIRDAKYVEVSAGLTFIGGNVGAANPDVAFLGASVKRVKIASTFIDTRVRLRADGPSGERGEVYQVSAKFRGDFTGAEGGDSSNILDVRGVDVLDLSGSNWNVTGAERFIKTSGTVKLAYANGLYMRGHCMKQVWDAYLNTETLCIENYDIDVSGADRIISNKQMYLDNPANQRLMYIGKGVARLTSDSIYALWDFQGPVGLPLEEKEAIFICSGCSGEMRGAGSGSGMFIATRGAARFVEDKNHFTRELMAPNSLSYDIRATSFISFGKSDVVGAIIISENSTTAGGVPYDNKLESISSNGLNLLDYNLSGGIYIDGGDGIDIQLRGGRIVNKPDSTNAVAAVRLANCNPRVLEICDVVSEPVVGRPDIVLSPNSTPTRVKITGNSWQYGSYSPPTATIDPGKSLVLDVRDSLWVRSGDVVSLFPDANVDGLIVNSYVRANGIIRVVVRNISSEPITIADGIWAWESKRIK